MASPVSVEVTGAVNVSPSTSTNFYPSLQEIMNLGLKRTYSQRQDGSPSIVGATIMAPFILPFGTITKGRFLALRASAALTMLITSPLGVDQLIGNSDLFVLHNPQDGYQLTTVKLAGTADIEYVLIGE